jgi:outer membrane translocation and assembly module TamA
MAERRRTDERVPRRSRVSFRAELWAIVLSVGVVLGAQSGCASIEQGRYAVSRLELDGMQQMASASLRECLVTRQRHRVTLRVGGFAPECKTPPFDSTAPEVALWTWSWAEWPTFNRSVFDQDLKVMLRWYRARGFYDARIEDVRITPEAAAHGAPCRSPPCRVEIRVVVVENQPVMLEAVEVLGLEGLSPSDQSEIRKVVTLKQGRRFDEVDYDRTKEALQRVLRDHSFAAAEVEGRVEVEPRTHRARVRFQVRPGASYVFGSVRVTGQGQLPETPIRLAAGAVTGEKYRPARVDEMRVEVLGLGAFSMVDVQEQRDDAQHRIDVTLKVTPLPPDELRLGIGLTSGASLKDESGDMESIPQWDVHLFGSYELRHVAGSLGTLRIEENPRLLFGDVFPRLTEPALGNVLSLKMRQPGVIEARTDLLMQSSWDYGPDPFLGFTRSDITLRAGVRRGFLAHHFLGNLALQQDLFLVGDGADNTTSDGTPTPSSYRYAFLEQEVRLDLRDDSMQPNEGAYFLVNTTESLRWELSDWSSIRLTPEGRFYFPLPLNSVFAVRAAVGALLIFDASPSLDELSARLGPSSYRLRGGGANSVRGFLPGELGAGTQGGLRRWEAMLEWRLRLGASLTAVTFMDFGDVNDAESFRFDHLNTSAGFGLRYFTFIGPVRLDAGFRIADWQRIGGSSTIEDGASTFPFTDIPGALHLTIGDSF